MSNSLASAPEADLDDEPTAQENEVTGDRVKGTLAGRTVYVPPVKRWRSSALSALRAGDFDKWAEVTLDDESYETWVDVDPTLAEIEDFYASVNPGLGTSPGNSRQRTSSSRRTRRR